MTFIRCWGVWGVVAAVALTAEGAWAQPNAAEQDGDRAAAADQGETPAQREREAPVPAPRPVPVHIEVRNDTGKPFRFLELRLVLDGHELVRRVAGKDAELEPRQRGIDTMLPPGPHRLETQAQLEGRKRGIFTYVDGYRVNLTNAFAFDVRPGQDTGFTVVLERDNRVTKSLEQQPAVRIEPNPSVAIIPAGGASPAPAVPTSTTPPVRR